MADETKESQETQVASETKADSAEVSATTEATETKQEVVETKETQTKAEEPEEPLDQAERTRLGRRVKRTEETLNTILSRLDSVLEQTRSRHDPEPSEEMPEVITTAEDVLKVVNAYQKRTNQKEHDNQLRYESDYIKTTKSLASTNPDLHDEIVDEIMAPDSPFNRKITGDAVADARINYSEAKAALLAKKTAMPKQTRPNVRGDKVANTSLSVETKTTDKVSAPIELDEFAKDFVSKIGMKDDSIRDALKGETPVHLASRK